MNTAAKPAIFKIKTATVADRNFFPFFALFLTKSASPFVIASVMAIWVKMISEQTFISLYEYKKSYHKN